MKVIIKGSLSGWQIFLNGIASEGGNIVVLFCLLVLVGCFVILKFDGATEQLYFVLGALVGVLKGRISTTHLEEKNTLSEKEDTV
jgi:hypothetical protein